MAMPSFKMLVGALAGLLVWLVMEPFAPKDPFSSQWEAYSGQLVLWLGISIGVALGGLSGWMQGGRVHLMRGIVIGGVLGAAGASIGSQIGNGILHITRLDQVLNNHTISFLSPFARMIGLTPIGTFIGAGIGMSSLNWRRGIQGAIGGTIGAGIGAALFDPISYILATTVILSKGVNLNGTAEVGIYGRAAFCILLGAGIGLFIGIVEQVSKVAWLRLVLGRNEGKEWVVDAPQTFIGRSESANVPLFGDPAVAPVHAVIVRQGPNYILADQGSQTGTFLNGQPVQHSPLFHGAIIQVGSCKLEFLMKVGSAPQRAAETLRSQQHYALQGQVPVAAPYAQPFAPGVPVPQAATAYGQPAGSMPTQVPMQPTSAPTVIAGQPMNPGVSNPTVVAGQPFSAATTTTLVATTGPMTGQRILVDRMLEIGREAAGLSLSFDSMASRRHASVSPSPAGVVVTDLGSTNGTFVNEQRIQTVTLAKGDLVRIGATVFRAE